MSIGFEDIDNQRGKMVFSPVPESTEYCKEWYWRYKNYYLISALLIPILITIVNATTTNLMSSLAIFEKHVSIELE
jgi:hypothetical protein